MGYKIMDDIDDIDDVSGGFQLVMGGTPWSLDGLFWKMPKKRKNGWQGPGVALWLGKPPQGYQGFDP